MDRQQLRQQFRQSRRSLSTAQQQHASEQLSIQLLSLATSRRPEHVALYLANDGEISPAHFCQQLWSLGIKTYLPVLDPTRPGFLLFVNFHSQSPMRMNKYGISEPDPLANSHILVNALDWVLVPLVAFDAQGNRLGMGGGYYDRTLAQLGLTDSPTRIFGLAHDCQQAAQLDSQDWDIPMQKIITPTQVFDYA